MRISDWSSDVCSSDLAAPAPVRPRLFPIASHIGEHRLGGGVPARFGDAAVGLLGYPRDDEDLLGARHRDIEQPPMLLGRGAGGRLIGLGKRAVPRSEGHTSELQSLMRIQ